VGEYKPRSRAAVAFWRIAHIVVGIILVWLPWMAAWENNLVLYFYPHIEPIICNPFFKGAVLGLGIDNVLVGIHDVIQARFAAKSGGGCETERYFF
jgi:hypothetical protein